MNITKQRSKGEACYLAGQVNDALSIYLKMIKHPTYKQICKRDNKANDLKGIVTMFQYLNRNEEALTFSLKLNQLINDASTTYLVAFAYYYLNDFTNAEIWALKNLALEDNVAAYDILSHAYAENNKLPLAKEAGEKALTIKAKEIELKAATPPKKLQHKITEFNTNDRSKNVISFTLFGDSPRYCENAIRNAQKVNDIYPNWHCRFYCATDVPTNIIKRLESTGAKVIIRPKTDDVKVMLFWRFDVMSDKSIDRYLVRDCDSVINEKESAAVDEWIISNKRFHIMRDGYTHTTLILAGMFGGTTDLFDSIESLIQGFLNQVHVGRMHLDQDFLSEKIWPQIKDDLLVHDNYFSHGKSLPFPISDTGYHVGENEGASAITFDNINNPTINWAILDDKSEIICQYETNVFNHSVTIQIPSCYATKMQNKTYTIKIL